MTDDFKQAAQEKLQTDPVKLGIYRHYKGGLYLVFAYSLDESTLTELVHYFSLERKTCWTRRRAEFFEIVMIAPGSAAPRFEFTRPATVAEVVALATVLAVPLNG